MMLHDSTVGWESGQWHALPTLTMIALSDARCCTRRGGSYRTRRTAIPLGGPSAWAHALQGFSGSAAAANTTVRSTEVRQAALARLPHLASSSSIIWNRPPHAEHHPKSPTSPTHCMCSRALCAARCDGEHRHSTGHCSLSLQATAINKECVI